jgi:hypothetical protein
MRERYVIAMESIGFVLIAGTLVYCLGVLGSTGIALGVGLVVAAQTVRTR